MMNQQLFPGDQDSSCINSSSDNQIYQQQHDDDDDNQPQNIFTIGQNPYEQHSHPKTDEYNDDNHHHDEQQQHNHPQATDPTKFTPDFLTRFLPWSYYIVYLLLTSMQELPMTSISWILNNETKFSPQELTIYYNLCFIPWTIKPLWGFIADNIPICGYRRKPYMIFFSFVASAVFILTPLFAHDKPIMRALGVIQALCVVFSEVQIDGLVVMYSNSLMDQQASLYRQFPEFKQLMSAKNKAKDKKNDKKKTTVDGVDQSSLNDNDTAETPLLTNGETNSESTLPVSPSTGSINSTTHQPTPQSMVITALTTPDEIFAVHPHYHDILTPSEFHLMMTQLPKALIQSEAMTFRTVSSLLSTIVSLLLHLWLSPTRVVWVCSIIPLILAVVIPILVPEKADSMAQKFAQRLKVITSQLSHYATTCIITIPTTDGCPDHENNQQQQCNNQATRDFKFFENCNCDEHQPQPPQYQIDSSPTNQNQSQQYDKPNQNETTTHRRHTKILPPPQNLTLSSTSSTSSDSDGNPEPDSSSSWCFNCLCGRVRAVFGAIMLVWKPLLFMLLLRSMPSPTDPMMSYVFGHLTLPPWLLSAYSFISIAGGLLASIAYWKYFVNISVVPAFVLFTILAAIFGSGSNFILTNEWMNLHISIPDWSKVFMTTFISSIFSRFAMMPTLILAAETAPQHFGLEATMFSIYTATNNLGNVISTVGNIFLIRRLHITSDDFSGLSTMVVICAIASVIPLLFSPLIWWTQTDLKKIEQERQEKCEKKEMKKLRRSSQRRRLREHLDERRPQINASLGIDPSPLP